jgi:integrase/recombinase XerC
MRAVLDAAAATAMDDEAIGLRDVAALELLYATGIRVGELVGLDVDHIDPERRLVRCWAKGSKNAAFRTVSPRRQRSAPGWSAAAQSL